MRTPAVMLLAAVLVSAPFVRPAVAGSASCAPVRTEPAWPLPELRPEVPPGYAPAPEHEVERGLWLIGERAEREIVSSAYRVRDAAAEALIDRIICRLVPEYAADIRAYLVRVPDFNASMMPNGAMQIWTGLLLRVDGEAELAAVIGHEIGHYLRSHSLTNFRKRRNTLSLTVAGSLGLAAVGTSSNTLSLFQITMIAGIFTFSRAQEREADAIGVALLARAGYDPMAASRVWAKLLDELPEQRRRRPALFDTHPPTPRRMERLATLAKRLRPDGGGEVGGESFEKAVAGIRDMLWEDQLERGEVPRTLVLVDRMIAAGRDPALAHCLKAEALRRRGNRGDLAAALADYERARAMTDDLPAWCWRGLGLALWRTGRRQEARAPLGRYLARAGDPPDRAAIEFYLSSDEGAGRNGPEPP
ncbi:MAG: hypothetical protein KatS3mg119_0857 [Rhodothalassiaceae bacterium]|nr:MAG: hypothetical protein KatS3mg119_0857 [Rhodothalassiaceae bacterium]